MSDRIQGFDGIRGLAALSVIFTHLHIFKYLRDEGYLSHGFVYSIEGAVGVQAFFVLSGFLITYLLIKESCKTGEVSLYNFYIRRTLRIFPLYFLVLTLVIFLHIFGEHVTNWVSIAFASFYSYNFIPKSSYSSLLGHTWSLAVEEHFYLIWPFMFIGLAYNAKKLLSVLIVFIFTSFALALLLSSWEWANSHFIIRRWSFIAGVYIAFGCLLSLLIFSHPKRDIFRKYLSMRLTLLIGIFFWFSAVWITGLNYFVDQYIRGFGLAIVIVWIYLNQQSIITKFLEIAPLRYIGVVSYGVYMYQGFFLSTGPHRLPDQTWPPNQSLGLILLIVVAPLSYHFFEKPITNLKSKLQRKKNISQNIENSEKTTIK